MIVQTFGNGVPIVILKNIIKDKYILVMLKEIEQIIVNNLLEDASSSTSAISDLKRIKNNRGLFIDDYYNERRDESDILNVHQIVNTILLDELENKHQLFRYFSATNSHNTLLSVYTNSNSYFEHFDRSVITAITYLWNQPKKFTGGNLLFNEYDIQYEPELGDVVVFPGFVRHEVSEVQMNNDDPLHGRYAISQFFHIR